MDASLLSEELRFLMRNVPYRVMRFEKHTQIFADTQQDASLGVVLSGSVYLCAENERYERSILRFFRSGDILLRAMRVPSESGVSYFTAKTAAEIALTRPEDVQSACRGHVDLEKTLSLLIQRTVQRGSADIHLLMHQKSIREKLLYFFRQEAYRQKSTVLTLPLPLADLAEYLAIDRTALMKELACMKSDGLLTGKNHTLRLNVPTVSRLP